jgi:hypothetical protein
MAAKKKRGAAKRKSAPKSRAAAKPRPAKRAAVRGADADVVYSDVRREMRSRLIGRLLGL